MDGQHPLQAGKGTVLLLGLWAPHRGGLAPRKAANAQTPSFLALASPRPPPSSLICHALAGCSPLSSFSLSLPQAKPLALC